MRYPLRWVGIVAKVLRAVCVCVCVCVGVCIPHLKTNRPQIRHPHTVLAVSNCIKHDGTSYAVLKHVEAEF